MQKFTILIEETVAGDFELIANNEEEAVKMAKENYRAGKFVLQPGELQHKQMAVILPHRYKREWIEF